MAVNFQKGNRIFWMIYHEIVRPGDNVRQIGLFSCSVALAEHLDLEINNTLVLENGLIDISGHKRTKDRLGSDAQQTGTSEVTEHKRQKGIKVNNRGGKTVKLMTTKEIANSQSKAAQAGKKPRHQGSFNFPGFVSTIDISDALATIIPTDKRSGNTAKIEPYFIMPSGNHFSIMSKERAEALSGIQGGSEVPDTPAAVKALVDKATANAPANP
ncbi:MAG: hypothetical protein AAGA60_10740 [Cyanobacteria bacterium P01_E01_bin.42]